MLTTRVEPLEDNIITLTVTVPAEQVDAAIRQAYETVGKDARIPGFRKGHAPKAVVDNYIGKENVLAEATEKLLDSSYVAAVGIEDLRPIEEPDLGETTVVVPGEDYTYTASVLLCPELALTHTDGITVTVPPKNVTEAQVDEKTEELRERFATLEPVEDRALKANDFALISFVADIDGEGYEGNEVDKYLYELGAGYLPRMFDEGLVGMNAGEQKRIEFLIPETSSNKEYVDKTAGFEVTLHEIKAKVLPEVDEEFAVSVGGFDSVAALREDAAKRMQQFQPEAHERAKREALRAELCTRLVGDVPESMVRERTVMTARNFQQMLEKEKMTADEYAKAFGASAEELKADVSRQAILLVSEELALEALFREKGLEVTDEDMRTEASNAAGEGVSVDDVLKRWTDSGLTRIAHDEATHRIGVRWLEENGTIIETDGTQAADAAAAALTAAATERILTAYAETVEGPSLPRTSSPPSVPRSDDDAS